MKKKKSDLSTSSVESEALGSDSKGRMSWWKEQQLKNPKGLIRALKGSGGGGNTAYVDLSALPTPTSTNIEVIGNLQVIVKKRTFETPKEINQYLKDNKKLTIREIAEKLNLPKTQVDHYFRTDKSRAIPSPKIWKKMKIIMNLDSRYDKQEMEFYEKEMEYEMTRRVHSEKGISPTLKGAKDLLVFTTPTSTNTQQPSTTIASKKATHQQTLGKSKPVTSQTLTSSVGDFLVNHFHSLVNGKVLKIPEGHYSLKYAESLGIKDLAWYSSKMSKGFLATTTELLLQSSSNRWMSWGMMSNGKCLTANISVFPKIGRGCSLSDILEEKVEDKYFLSEKATISIMGNVRSKLHEQ